MPYFISTQIPNGLRGLVMGAMLMATLSTLAPMINACSVTWMDDFFKRLFVRNASEKSYLLFSRITTVLLGVVMIVIAYLFHSLRNNTLQEFNYILSLVVSAGMMGLFFIGFFSRWVSGKAAGVAMILTISLMVLWLVLDSAWGKQTFPQIAPYVPNLLWTCVLSNSFFMVAAMILGLFFPKPSNDSLRMTTWQGLQAQIREQEAAAAKNKDIAKC